MRTPIALAAAIFAVAAHAAVQPVQSIEIVERGDAFGGAAFGDVGAYERIVALAHMRIDPKAPENRAIADLDKAPRDADGLVDYATDLVILRPKQPDKASRVLLYDVVNRGNKLVFSLNDSMAGDLAAPNQAGNGFLMRQGYTVVWSGWQGDIAGHGMVVGHFPVAGDAAHPVTGKLAQEAIFENAASTGTIPLPYPAATLDQSGATLTVRERALDTPRTIDPADWRFVDASSVTVKRPADMDGGAIYEFVYTAKDPIVAGLGFAATRDLISFLRHDAKTTSGDANPLADMARNGETADAAVAMGASQSGRYLRDFLWQGFNADGHGRKVFDGVFAEIAGGRKTFTNVRWSQPGRFSRQHEDHFVYGDQFPFTYATLTDPITGKRDGILRACEASKTCPKIFHVDTSAEFWQADSALVGTDGAGHDVSLPGDVRAYMIAGAAHYPVAQAPICRNPGNTLKTAPALRALLVDLVDWTRGTAAPPPSAWPSIGAHTLAPPTVQVAVGFPDLGAIGMNYSGVANTVRPLDFGTVPPKLVGDRSWRILVPTTDSDGNDLPGIRLPEIAVPRGTYLGWNLRKAGFAEGELCNLYGSFRPFAADKPARDAAHDPRLSLAERYKDGSDYVAKVIAAAKSLRDRRLLLDEDVDRYQARAAGPEGLQ